MTKISIARGIVTFAAGVLSLVAVLAYQDANHGWPFSRHHGLDPIVGTSARTPAEVPPSRTGQRAAVRIPADRRDRFGIRSEPVREASLASELRVTATVVPDEARIAHVHTRVSGWIESLAVRTTGESVRAGQTLAAVFSQELLASQTEYLAVRKAAPPGPPSALVLGARERLRVLGMTDAELATLDRRSTPTRAVAIVAPRSGVVVHRGVTLGASVDPSTELFTIVDLGRVWIIAEVPEARAQDVRLGTHATIEVPASARPPVDRPIEFVYPTLSEGTRTLRVRFELENQDASLRPGMFGTSTFHIEPRVGMAVPRDAIVDTGAEQHVFVERSPGYYEPRMVPARPHTDDLVEILAGLGPGDRVAVSGVFLLDSESRLRATGSPVGHGGHGGASAHEPTTTDAGSANPSRGAHAGHGN